MAFVHCHSCGWEQDDFYSVLGYNPAKSLLDWMDQLCGPKLDQQFTDDAGFIREHGNITLREVIVREFEKFARSIRDMRWVTEKQFKDDPDKKCPNCGSLHLDVD